MPYDLTPGQRAARWVSRAGERAHWADAQGNWLGGARGGGPGRPRWVPEHQLHLGTPGPTTSFDMRERGHWALPSGRWVAPPPGAGTPSGGAAGLVNPPAPLAAHPGGYLMDTPAQLTAEGYPGFGPDRHPAQQAAALEAERRAWVEHFRRELTAAARANARGRRPRYVR